MIRMNNKSGKEVLKKSGEKWWGDMRKRTKRKSKNKG
jgi:hypothetical protein